MNPIQTINPKKDSSFALLLNAQRRGWNLFYMELPDLFLQDSIPWARMRPLTVTDNEQCWFSWSQEQHRPLHQLQVILMRQDPPVDMHYIYTTQLLDRAEQAGVLVINKPQSLRDCNEKLFALWFPQCCPPTLVTHSIQAAKQFLHQHQDVICKPLDGMGGKSIFRLRTTDPNINTVLETLTQQGQCYMLVQQYLAAIVQGDKRILLIAGEPVPYALARIAAAGETRANLAAGGHGRGVALTTRDRWICEQVGPCLRDKGLLLVGLDVIGDYLTEINITSPTCIRELEACYDLDISDQFLDCVASRLANNH